MTDFLLDSNNDLDFTKKLITLTKDPATLIRQKLLILLRTNKNEWKFNINLGLPWVTPGNQIQILSKDGKQFADTTIRNAIISVDEVLRIDNYLSTYSPETRMLTITVNITTSEGAVTITI